MISVIEHNKLVSIHVNADLINTSDELFDLPKLKSAIISQLAAVYRGAVGSYSLSISIEVSILKRISQCSHKKILFQIVNSIAGNNPAEADFKGLRIKLNKNYINDIILNKNKRTIPHELGHLFGWDHPHANAAFESINSMAHPLEQQLSEAERQTNLMSQTWYAQKAQIPLDKAILLSKNQIELLLLNHRNHELNKNKHLNYFLWWKKIV